MLNSYLITPFQIAMNNFELDIFINHIIGQINTSSNDIPQNNKSFYLENENISFRMGITKESEGYKILSKYDFTEVNSLRRGYTSPVNDFLNSYVDKQIFKIRIKRQKVKDNKKFMENLTQTIFNRFGIALERIYGIIAIDSKKNKRLLNLTYPYISKLICNGLLSLDYYDEFFIFVYKKEVEIKKFSLEPHNIIEKFTEDIFELYAHNRFSKQNPSNKNIANIYNIDMRSLEISSYNLGDEINLNLIKLMFIPTHFISSENNSIYPYYAYGFVKKPIDTNLQRYITMKGLDKFITGNVGEYICTGNENNTTFYGLTTLEGYNANSEFSNSNIILSNVSRGTNNVDEILEFVQNNVRLSLMNYIEKEENEPKN